MRLLVVEKTADYLIYFINEDTEYKQGKVLIQGHTKGYGQSRKYNSNLPCVC